MRGKRKTYVAEQKSFRATDVLVLRRNPDEEDNDFRGFEAEGLAELHVETGGELTHQKV